MRLSMTLAAVALFATSAFADTQTTTSEQELAGLNDRFNEFAAEGDLEGILSLYADDALWIAPATPPVAGHDAPRETFKFLIDNDGSLTHSVDELFVSDDGTLAVMIGGADINVEKVGMKAKGTYLFVLRRSDAGNWQIETDMWHQHADK